MHNLQKQMMQETLALAKRKQAAVSTALGSQMSKKTGQAKLH
jgi:hypothetical protein